MLYVQYLTEQARPTEAAAQLEIVAKAAENNPFTTYNVGLLYFDLKDYARARQYAKKAMDMGLAKPELQEMLQKAGQWQGAETSTPAASAPQQ